MKPEIKNAVRVTPSTKIRFKCTGCAECCRHVKQTVPVDSRDAFRITKYLMESGEEIFCTDQFLVQYAEPAMIDECGYFVYFLKTVGPDELYIPEGQPMCDPCSKAAGLQGVSLHGGTDCIWRTQISV